MGDVIGQSVAGYPIQKLLGKGSYSEVYQAATSAAPLAVKLLREDLRQDAELNRLICKGWEETRGVVHSNLVVMYSAGVDPVHGAFCLEEVVAGKSLRKIALDGSKVAWRDASILAEQLFSALQALHQAGKTHGDIWPSNILITQDQDLKLEGAGGLSQIDLWPTEILPGPPVGYLAPELIRGSPATASADLYSAGACLYFIMAGRDFFPGDNTEAVARNVLDRPPTPLSAFRDDVPAEAVEFINRLTAKDPTQRYASADDVLGDLARLKSGQGLAPLRGGQPPLPPRPERAKPAAEQRPASKVITDTASKLAFKTDTRSGSGANKKIGSGTSLIKDAGTIKVFGRLDTQVKSTIPQSDMEKQGDDFYRHGQLPLALNCWKDAFENHPPHTGLKVKIELAERDMKKEAYGLAMEEARHRLLIGDHAGAISRAREALLSVENDQQRQEALVLESEGLEAQQRAARATTIKFSVLAVLFILAVFVLFAYFAPGRKRPVESPSPPDEESAVEPVAGGIVGDTPRQPERFKIPDSQASLPKPKGWIVANTQAGLAEMQYLPTGSAHPTVSLRISKLPAGASLVQRKDELKTNSGLKNNVKLDEQPILIDGRYECWRLAFRYNPGDNPLKPSLHYFYLISGPAGAHYLAEFDGAEDFFNREMRQQIERMMLDWSYKQK